MVFHLGHDIPRAEFKRYFRSSGGWGANGEFQFVGRAEFEPERTFIAVGILAVAWSKRKINFIS